MIEHISVYEQYVSVFDSCVKHGLQPVESAKDQDKKNLYENLQIINTFNLPLCLVFIGKFTSNV